MWIYYNLVEQDHGHQKRREPESQRADVMYSGHQRFSLPVPDKENRCDMYVHDE